MRTKKKGVSKQKLTTQKRKIKILFLQFFLSGKVTRCLKFLFVMFGTNLGHLIKNNFANKFLFRKIFLFYVQKFQLPAVCAAKRNFFDKLVL